MSRLDLIRNIKKGFMIICFVFLLTACSLSTSGGSYAIIVVVNNTEYNGTEEKLEDYDVDKSLEQLLKRYIQVTFQETINQTILKKVRLFIL